MNNKQQSLTTNYIFAIFSFLSKLTQTHVEVKPDPTNVSGTFANGVIAWISGERANTALGQVGAILTDSGTAANADYEINQVVHPEEHNSFILKNVAVIFKQKRKFYKNETPKNNLSKIFELEFFIVYSLSEELACCLD
jgi:predicted transcriptional regulator with HTH domain